MNTTNYTYGDFMQMTPDDIISYLNSEEYLRDFEMGSDKAYFASHSFVSVSLFD